VARRLCPNVPNLARTGLDLSKFQKKHENSAHLVFVCQECTAEEQHRVTHITLHPQIALLIETRKLHRVIEC
jgi:hypothetical protein